MTKILSASPIRLRDVLVGRLLVEADTLARHAWLRKLEKLVNKLGEKIFGVVRRSPPEEGGPGLRDAGRLAPLRPTPGHHLVAAKALPPGDGVHLLPKD